MFAEQAVFAEGSSFPGKDYENGPFVFLRKNSSHPERVSITYCVLRFIVIKGVVI